MLLTELLAKMVDSDSPTGKGADPGKKMDMYTLRKRLQQAKPKHVLLYDKMRAEATKALNHFFS